MLKIWARIPNIPAWHSTAYMKCCLCWSRQDTCGLLWYYPGCANQVAGERIAIYRVNCILRPSIEILILGPLLTGSFKQLPTHSEFGVISPKFIGLCLGYFYNKTCPELRIFYKSALKAHSNRCIYASTTFFKNAVAAQTTNLKMVYFVIYIFY